MTGRVLVSCNPSGFQPQPSGRKTIAQHLSAGSASRVNQVPAGTKETVRHPASFVPAGTFRLLGRQPSTEVLGYFRWPLRDGANALRTLQGTEMIPDNSFDPALVDHDRLHR